MLAGALAALLLASFVGGPGGVAPAFADERAPGPEASPAPDSAGVPGAAGQRIENVIAAARQYLGVPYRVGSEGPSLFDCSGLVFRAFSDADLADRIGGNRLRAAGYMRWFARQGLMTASEEDAQRGDLVVYDNGRHIGIYLGDGRTISALVSGVTVHSLRGISQAVTGFLRPDWSGRGEVPVFVPVEPPEVTEVPEAPALLVPAPAWYPTLENANYVPIEREGVERVDMRTPSTRTFENRDGTFTTEFHGQAIHYLPSGEDQLEPIDLRFGLERGIDLPTVSASPVALTARSADHADGLLSATAGSWSVSLHMAGASDAAPLIVGEGEAVDYAELLPGRVGLRVAPAADGFRGFIVLSREPERNRFTFQLDAPGLTAALDESGDVALLDNAGSIVARVPRPMLLDSSDVDGYGGGLSSSAAALELSSDGDTTLLTIVVRPRFLAEAAFPAYLDLSLTGFAAAEPAADVALVSSRHPDATLSGFARPEAAGLQDLWLGRQPRSKVETAALLRFNELTATLGTVDVAAASLELLPYLQRDDEVAALVSRAGGEWDATSVTWNSRPSIAGSVAPLAGSSAEWLSVDVSGYATDVLSRGSADDGLVLHGPEGAGGTWKRFFGGALGPRLVVTWSGLRPTALALDASDAPTQAAPEDDAEAVRTLRWSLPTIAPDQARFEVEVSRDGFATVDLASGVVKGKAGLLPEWDVPRDALGATSGYEWRVRVRFADGGWSEWSVSQPLT